MLRLKDIALNKINDATSKIDNNTNVSGTSFQFTSTSNSFIQILSESKKKLNNGYQNITKYYTNWKDTDVKNIEDDATSKIDDNTNGILSNANVSGSLFQFTSTSNYFTQILNNGYQNITEYYTNWKEIDVKNIEDVEELCLKKFESNLQIKDAIKSFKLINNILFFHYVPEVGFDCIKNDKLYQFLMNFDIDIFEEKSFYAQSKTIITPEDNNYIKNVIIDENDDNLENKVMAEVLNIKTDLAELNNSINIEGGITNFKKEINDLLIRIFRIEKFVPFDVFYTIYNEMKIIGNNIKEKFNVEENIFLAQINTKNDNVNNKVNVGDNNAVKCFYVEIEFAEDSVKKLKHFCDFFKRNNQDENILLPAMINIFIQNKLEKNNIDKSDIELISSYPNFLTIGKIANQLANLE